jgi:hypothetical protein
VAISLETGTVYGMVVAHDPNTLMTYIVPAISVFQTITERCGQRSLSAGDMFSVSGLELDASTLIEKAVSENSPAKNEGIGAHRRGFLPRSVRPISGDINILQAFLSVLEAYTLISQEGKPYIRTEALSRWLRSDSGATSHIDLLLDYAYSKYTIVPVDPDQISKNGDPCLYIFSVLLELGHGDLIDRFQRLGLTDRSLPVDHPRLQRVLAGLELPDSSILAKDFFDTQWAYAPLILALDMGRDNLPVQTVIPILRKHQINAKGGSATLWQIEVLEDFVDHRLREVAVSAKSNDAEDTVGYVSDTPSIF